MDTLADRLEQLRNTKFGGVTTRMSTACGLKRTHLGTLLARLRRNPASNVEDDTLQKIASTCGVTVDWLLGREAHHDHDDVTECAIRVALAAGADPDLAERTRQELYYGARPWQPLELAQWLVSETKAREHRPVLDGDVGQRERIPIPVDAPPPAPPMLPPSRRRK